MNINKTKALVIKNITIEVINSIVNSIAMGDKINLTPEDIQIFKIWRNDDYFISTYNMILTSDLFPIVREGEVPREGEIYFSRKNENELLINVRKKK